MKKETHPEYKKIKVTCSCGHVIETSSTLCAPLAIEVCANCHPFYTGKQKIIDSGGQVQKFYDRYKESKKTSSGKASSDKETK